MQLFYFTGTGNGFDLVNNSLATRAGLLLADKTIIDDSSMFLADVDRVFGNRKQATKIIFATRWMDVHHPDQAAELREFAQMAKATRAKKRKDKADLIVLKQFDIYVEASYSQYTDFLKALGAQCGLYQLQPLVKEPFLLFYSYSSDSPECADDDYTPVSELLQMMGDGYERRRGEPIEEDVVWVLPMEFLSPALLPPGAGRIATALPAGALPEADEEAIWIEPLLEMNNINIFDADEVRAVRQDLRGPGTAFRAAADAWIADCHQNRRTVRERARFFEEIIRPAAQPLQEVFTENKIVVAHQQAQGEHPVCLILYAVELPLRALWGLYEKQGYMPQESLLKLRALWETAGRRRFPMFVILPQGLYASDKDTFLAAAQTDKAFANPLPDVLPTSARKSIDL